MDLKAYQALETMQERAKYLLQQEITTMIDIVDLTPVARACIGKIQLPIVGAPGETDEQVVAKAKAWLQETAGGEA
ncbi:hypothetical protein ACE1OG_10035 [Aeromonas hydrophila]|uniref:hypothetical protein n=1 Tax=Aeromonas TaxID=642 RepID=UPI0005CED02E|nr:MULTISPECIES: hypothetical protein [Aeromonas]AJQ52649.1 hypothetical protein RY45_00530 [Aeromonas hydrophila]MCR6739946.1 hypothetical protein [Aeromonas dhakensis]TNH88806.1 hypothetical protein CF139_10350 [Aeromonas hydrophila]WAF69365.1 hypothetical protein NRK98_04775 [Aeromonas dhakensis]HAU4886177.1 hypothetical protein [Aeromonas hydrophila]